MLITIVIPTFNRFVILKMLIDSLRFQTRLSANSYRICVSDGGSSDETSSLANKCDIFIEPLVDNERFWTQSIQAGIEASLDSDFVLLINDDIELPEDLIWNIDILLSNNDNHVIYTSKVLNADGSIYSLGGTISRFGLLKIRKKINSPLLWAGGMCTIFNVALIKDIGNFDSENFPHYIGDRDFFYRATLAGWVIKLIPDLFVVHKDEGRLYESFRARVKNVLDKKSFRSLKGNLLFYGKNDFPLITKLTFILKTFIYVIGGLGKIR